MPNHVHAVVEPLAGFDLPAIMHFWKSYSAHVINDILGRKGTVWQDEYYDHLIRDEGDLRHSIDYAWGNPEKAGLVEWKLRARSDDILEVEEKKRGRDARARQRRACSESRCMARKMKRKRPPASPTSNPASARRRRTARSPLGSPFDYAKQATLYIESDLPDPNDTAPLPPGRVREDHPTISSRPTAGRSCCSPLQDADRRGQPAEAAARRAGLPAARAGAGGAAEDPAGAVPRDATTPCCSAPAASGRGSTCRGISCAT